VQGVFHKPMSILYVTGMH